MSDKAVERCARRADASADAQQGKTYFFAVTSFDGDEGGDFVFNLNG